MRRLSMLVLVLCLSSAGYATVATLDITVNDQPYTGQSVEPSDIIKVVWNTTTPIMGGYAGVNFDVSDGEYIPGSLIPSPPWWIEERDTGFAVVGNTSGMPFPAGWTFEFEFHVPYLPPSTIIVLDALAGGYGGSIAQPGPGDDWPYAELHVTPEPMTIALLGLGGLFLRRRK